MCDVTMHLPGKRRIAQTLQEHIGVCQHSSGRTEQERSAAFRGGIKGLRSGGAQQGMGDGIHGHIIADAMPARAPCKLLILK